MQVYLSDLEKDRECHTIRDDRCVDVVDGFIAGGDRLARYLLGQYEGAHEAGRSNTARWLNYASYTGATVALDYIAAIIAADPAEIGHEKYLEALHALARSPSPRASRIAIDRMRTPFTGLPEPYRREYRSKLLGALVWIARYTEQVTPEVLGELRALEMDTESDDRTLRASAFHGLNSFEELGLLPPRDRPVDLESKRKEREHRHRERIRLKRER